MEKNGRRRSLRRPKLSAVKESSAPGRRRNVKYLKVLGKHYHVSFTNKEIFYFEG